MSVSPLALTLQEVLGGELAGLSLIKQRSHTDLRRASKELEPLRVSRKALRNVLESWQKGTATALDVGAWASLLMRGYLKSGPEPLKPLDIEYEEEHEELIAAIVARLEELGDKIDGVISESERQAMIESLSSE